MKKYLFIIVVLGFFSLGCRAKPAQAALTIDQTVAGSENLNLSSSSPVISNSVTTNSNNELILAIISVNTPTGGSAAISGVTGGGLVWNLATRSNAHDGDAEIWYALATSAMSAVTFSGSISSSSPCGSNICAAVMSVVTFRGIDLTGVNGSGAIGATSVSGSVSGTPSSTLITTRGGSWVIGSLFNWTSTSTPTVPSGQTGFGMVAGSTGEYYWGQMQSSATPTGGTLVTINDTAPTGIDYSEAIVEILPALPPPTGYSVNASSTHFFTRSTVGDIFGNSNSIHFGLYNNGQPLALGIGASTHFMVTPGIIRPIFQPVKPNYALIHYHWRLDNGSEANASSATGGVEDTPLTGLNTNSSIRLRTEITNDGGTIFSYTPQSFQLQYGLSSTSTCSSSSVSSWTVMGAGSDWSMDNSVNLNDGSDTTNIAVSTGGVLDANHTFTTPNAGVKDATSTVNAILVPSDSFLELEFDVEALSPSTPSGTYCFRLTNNGSTSNFTYAQYPSITLSSSTQSISLVINPSTISLPNLVPGIPVVATTTVTVTASGATNGYFLQIYRNSATSTLASSSIPFPDAAPLWSISGTTCAVGQGNATATLGQNFSFRVASSGTSGTYCPLWWGASDASGTAAYAGVPTAGTTIINSTNTNSENGSTTVAIVYRANASATTTIAAYTGQVTITAIANP